MIHRAAGRRASSRQKKLCTFDDWPAWRWGAENPPWGVRVPAVDPYQQDLQDNGPVSLKSLLHDYAPGPGAYDIYFAYIALSDLPAPQLVGGADDYDWTELQSRRTAPPPPKLYVPFTVNHETRSWKEGSPEILDGNHRLHFWEAAGYDVVPVWVIQALPHCKG